MTPEIHEDKRPFIFDDHISPMTPKIVRDYLMSKWFNKLTIFTPNQKIKLESRVNSEVKELNKDFDFVRNFFEAIREYESCNLEYSESYFEGFEELKKCKIKISGSGKEIFQIRGEPIFKDSKEENKSTVIPVKSGFEEFNLEIPDILQKIEISVFENLRVFYRFNTEISLDDSFNKNPLKTNATRGYSDGRSEPIHFLYGSPGNIIYRCKDGFFEEVGSKIIAPWLSGDNKRKEINLQGKLYIGDDLLYKGKINSDGYFPFIIPKEGNNSREGKPLLEKLILA